MREVHGWRRVGRWSVGIIGGLVGLVGLVLLVAAIVFQTGWGRGILKNQVEKKLASTFAGGGSVGRVDGNPLSDLVLYDVVINSRDKQPAIKIKKLTVKLPLLPLISHQLRVEKVIADDLDVLVKKLPDGTFNLANMKNPSEPSTWNVMLPDTEVHRGHVRIDRGKDTEVVDVDNLELAVDAKLPFAGPIDANVMITGTWRQKHYPLSVGAVIHGDKAGMDVRNAGVQVDGLRVVALGVHLPKGQFAKAYSGTVAVVAPAKVVKELAPNVQLPDDMAIAIAAHPHGRLTGITANVAIGHRARVNVFGSADVVAKQVNAVVIGDDLGLYKLTNGKLDGRGGVFAALHYDGTTKHELPTASGVVTAWTTMPDTPPLEAAIAIDSFGDQLLATVGAASSSGILAGAGAAVRKRGDVITLERGQLIARTRDIGRASAGKAPVHGTLSANLMAEGQLAPKPDLSIAGHANGRHLSAAGATAGALALRVDAKHVPAHPAGSGRVELTEVQRGDLQFTNLTVAAGNRPDGKLQVTVRSHPKPAPWQVDVDALVTTGNTMIVDLQRHFVRAAGGSVWSGNTGRVTITPTQIQLTGLRSKSSNGNFAADGTYVRAGRHKGDLAAKLDADVELGSISKGHKGHVTAHVDMKREAMRLSGIIEAHGKSMTLRPNAPMPFDGDVKIEARDQQVLANVDIATQKAGSAKLAVDVAAPKDITNVKAWSKLDRDAVRSAQLTLQKIDLAGIAKLTGAKPMSGSVNGTLELSPAKAGGSIAIRDVKTPQTEGLGAIQADLKLAQADQLGDLRASLVAKLVPAPNSVAADDVTKHGQAKLTADATLRTPDKIFDAAAWKHLGHNAFRGAQIRAEKLAFQPGTLERLGIVTALRGEVAAGVDVGEGMHDVRFSANLYNLRGGLLAKPVAVNIVGQLDQRSTRAQADVRAEGVTLLHFTSQIPVTIDQLRADPKSAKEAALTGEARINNVPAKTLMTVIGTSQITGGTLDGTIALGGTVSKPTVDAKLVAKNVTVPNEGTRQVQQIQQLTIAGTWDGAAAKVAIDGTETGGGKLQIQASGSPADLDNVAGKIQATKVDIAPLVAFMPGPAGGLAGQLDADFTLKGANPKTAQVAGKLAISRGRIPIAPQVGTLFQGNVSINVQNQTFGLRMTGKLGKGDVTLTANAPLEGVTPKNGKARLVVHNVQLIGTTEPIITGTIDADLARIGDTWRSDVRVTQMKVKVPKTKGQKLKPAGTPPDLVYGGLKVHHELHHGQDVPKGIVKDTTGAADFKAEAQNETTKGPRSVPNDALLVAYINARNIEVESEEVRGLVGAQMTIAVGNDKAVTIVGNVALTRGVLDLFNRRYNVDKAALHFDGSPDPVLDVRITHDFKEVTTITVVRGRMSKPQLVLSSDPARYSQAELLGFLLGGEPGGDPENAPSAAQRVEGAGASIVANKIGGYVKKSLPVDIDVLRYEAASANSSAAVTVGTWITDTLFLAYRQHLQARPDENTGEGEVEYWIKKRLVLEGVIGDRGVNGADLLWRRRW